MCSYTLAALHRSAAFEEHNWFHPGGLARLLQELTAIPEPFHIDENYPRIWVCAKVLQVFVKFNIRFIAHTHVVVESHLAF